jgi:spermidine synthase
MVIEACKETMSDINDNALSDPLVKVIVSEAREYLIRNEWETHDLIIADLTEPYDSAGSGGELSRQLFSRRFYDRVKGMLTPERGIFVIQTGGLTFVERVDRLRKEIVQGLNAVFRNVKTFYQYIHSFDMVWTITVCSDRDYDWDRFDPEPALEQRNIFDLKHYDRLSHLAATIAPRNMRELFGQ